MNTIWERKILRKQSSSGALADLFSPFEFVDNALFVTKAGYLTGILRVDPTPFETLAAADVDVLSRRFEAALRGLDPDIRVYQYLLKTELQEIPHRPIADPLLDRLTVERLTYLQDEKGPLYSIDVFFALVYETRIEQKRFVLPERGAATLDRNIRVAAHLLRTSIEGFSDGVRDVIGVELLGQRDAFAFLRRLVTYAPEDREYMLQDPWDLGRQLSASTVEADGALKVGRYMARVFTLAEPPKTTSANLLKGLHEIPSGAILVTEWKPLPVEHTDKIVHQTQRYLNHLLTSVTNGLSREPPKEHEILIDEGKHALIKQLGDALKQIQTRGLYFGECSFSIVLYHENSAVLRAAAAKVANVLHPHGAQITEHLNRAALAAWLSVVPGNDRYNCRRINLSNVNYADLSFIFAPHKGQARNDHLQDESLAVMTTHQRTVYHLNLHVGQVGHTLITGRIGSGKSYLLKFLIANVQKYDPFTIIFDVTRTFRGITEAFGGSYVELGRSGSSASINPFCLPKKPENIAFLSAFVRMLLESDVGSVLTNDEMEDIYTQVDSLYTLPPGARRLGKLALAPRLERRLSRWTRTSRYQSEKAGQYAHLFDNETDTLTFSNFQTYSFPQMDREPEALEALLFYVLHRSLEFIWETDRPSFVFMDEARNFVRHPTTQKYILDALANWRKQLASLILVLHSITDMPERIAQELVEKCLTRIHGPNPGINTADWMRTFRMSKTQAELIGRLIPGKQFLVQDSGIIDLLVDPQSDAVYRTGMEKEREESI